MQVAPSASPPVGPGSNERAFAGLAYLGYLLGPWLIVPLAIYLFWRKKSRWVAHHAMRAMLLQLAVLAYVAATSVISVATMIYWAYGGTLALMMALSLLALLPVVLVVTIIAAVNAFQGEQDPDAIFAGATEWLLERDRVVPRAPASGGAADRARSHGDDLSRP